MDRDFLFALLGIAVAVSAVVFTYWIYRKGGGRRRVVVIGLEEIAVFNPRGLGIDIAMKVGTWEVENVALLALSVTNKGPGDVVTNDPDSEEMKRHRPTIHLPAGFRAVTDPWFPGGARSDADLRVARTLNEQGIQQFHIHIHRLGEKATASAHVICTNRNGSPELTPGSLRLVGGFVSQVTFKGKGLLPRRPENPSRSAEA